MNSEREYLTKEKFKEFEQELEVLRTTKRSEVAAALEYAKSLGDLSENAEYHDARDMQARVEDRINHLEALLKTAQIVDHHDTSMVGVGTVITIEKSGGSKTSYTLVGSEEADAGAGKISVRSPLGLAAMGKKKGESFSFKTPGGIMNYKITDIK